MIKNAFKDFCGGIHLSEHTHPLRKNAANTFLCVWKKAQCFTPKINLLLRAVDYLSTDKCFERKPHANSE